MSMIDFFACCVRQEKIGAELHKSTCRQRDRPKARIMKATTIHTKVETKSAVTATTLTKVLPISVELAAANENNFAN